MELSTVWIIDMDARAKQTAQQILSVPTKRYSFALISLCMISGKVSQPTNQGDLCFFLANQVTSLVTIFRRLEPVSLC